MVDRFLLWLSAGVIAAGVSAAMIAGAGVAAADSGSPSDGGGATSSESAKPAGNKADSKTNPDKTDTGKANTDKDASDESKTAGGAADPKRDDDPGGSVDPKDADDLDSTNEAEAEEQDPGEATDETGGPVEQPAEEPTAPVADDQASGGSDTAERATNLFDKSADTLDKTASVTQEPAAQTVVDAKVAAPAEQAAKATSQPAATNVEPAPAVIEITETKTTVTATSSAVTLASAPSNAEITATAHAPLRGPLIDLIGSLVFTLFSLATRLFEGPPMLPPGSTVTVRTSTLHIDCGPGYEVPANWYFPSDPEPTRLIYLQHGFLAGAPFYSYTAATLAEQTNSIVVATSLSSNLFACDSCWLGGAPMQRAVADLFKGERTALLASASAALGEDVTLPQRVVLVGHSAGGGLVANTAGYMVDNGTVDDLAGVVMLDGVSFNLDALSTALGKLPEDLPVLQIASPRYFWNLWGDTISTMAAARPDRFNGVELVDGLHIDAMQGGNPLIQFGAYLVAGFSKQQNIEAAKILAVDWINDMFAGNDIYEAPGSTIQIPTDAGNASAIAIPAPLTPLSPLDQLVRAVVLFALRLFIGYEPVVHTAAVPSQGPDMALIGEFSPPNGALTLDGKASKGQSVGQHVCTG